MSLRQGRRPLEFSSDAVERLLGYRWPGNIRELENIIERAVILCDGDMIDSNHVYLGEVAAPAGLTGEVRPLQQVEHDAIVAALQASRGKVSGPGGAAQLLGLKPSTLESRMKKLGIERLRASI
jgi:two-component system response regulator HydG